MNDETDTDDRARRPLTRTVLTSIGTATAALLAIGASTLLISSGSIVAAGTPTPMSSVSKLSSPPSVGPTAIDSSPSIPRSTQPARPEPNGARPTSTGRPSTPPTVVPVPPRVVPLVVTAAPAAPAEIDATSCPATVRFVVVVSVSNAPAEVRYEWDTSDGVAGPEQSLPFSGSGPQSHTVPLTRTVDGNYRGWVRLHVLSPSDVLSEPIPFVVSCASVVTPNLTSATAFVTPACDQTGTLDIGTITIGHRAPRIVSYTWLLDGTPIHTVALEDTSVGVHPVSGPIRFTGRPSVHSVVLRVTSDGVVTDSAPLVVRPVYCV